MYRLLKPLLFNLDAELTHDLALRFLALTGGALEAFSPAVVEDPLELMGLSFRNRVGLAAGLDKNARCIAGLQAMGFGSIEVGTVTPRAQPGNPKPRMFRLADRESIINRMGFNNEGVDQLVERVALAKRKWDIPLGINIGKNKATPQSESVSDYLYCLDAVSPLADYVTVNLSSPNTPGLRDLQFGEALDTLLAQLSTRRAEWSDKLSRAIPLLVKIAPDMATEDLLSVADRFVAHGIDGIIATNTTIERSSVANSVYAGEAGGLSGRSLTEKSTEIIRQLSTHLGGALAIIGVGGIHSGVDAVAKIEAGADMVQLYTGLVYRGPALVGESARAIKTPDKTEIEEAFILQRYMATCPKGLEYVLANELRSLGAEQVQESVAACYFSAALAGAYHICWWTRVANRIVLLLVREQCHSLEDLQALLRGLAWSDWFSAQKRIAVDFNGSNSFVKDSRFGAQITKDSVNDHFVALGQPRLVVDRDQPEVLIYARLFKSRFSLGLDLVGESLHRRGYRRNTGEAPIKENLAAAILLILGWQQKAVEYGSLIDPMCGSATLLIEAALISNNTAPGYLRESWLCHHLLNFEEALWQHEASAARASGSTNSQPIRLTGFDSDAAVIAIARANIEAAGLQGQIVVERRSVSDRTPMSQMPQSLECGLVVVNPPYGKRLGDSPTLAPLYSQLGDWLKYFCEGWDAAVFTGNPDLGWSTGLRSWRQHKLFNGSIECQLQRYRISQENYSAGLRALNAAGMPLKKGVVTESELGDGGKMLANRLRKNLRRLKPWLKQHPQISCYRVYDADLPEYAAAIDYYQGIEIDSGVGNSQPWKTNTESGETKIRLLIQEYVAPNSIDATIAKQRVHEIEQAVSVVFAVDRSDIIIKRRQRQRGSAQYQKQAVSGRDMIVVEHGHRFRVNLEGYLDTGVFLDHRAVRCEIARIVKGGSFLNLFAYTATATVYAASAGARSSVSVDMSNTYIQWAEKNFRLNQLSTGQHRLLRADCVAWLGEQATANKEGAAGARKYSCILLDPPSFSNSKRMESAFDVQRDHAKLVEWCMDCLEPEGVLFFSNNRRGFKLDLPLQQRYRIEDISKKTHDPDVDRQRLSHQCWSIRFAD